MMWGMGQQSAMVGLMLCYGGEIGHTLCCTLCIPGCTQYFFLKLCTKVCCVSINPKSQK